MSPKRLLRIALIGTFLPWGTSGQGGAAPEVLPKQGKPFADAKIGQTYKDSKPGTMSSRKLQPVRRTS